MIVHSVAVGNEQLASIANGKRMLGNSFVRERVVEIFYFYMSGGLSSLQIFGKVTQNARKID